MKRRFNVRQVAIAAGAVMVAAVGLAAVGCGAKSDSSYAVMTTAAAEEFVTETAAAADSADGNQLNSSMAMAAPEMKQESTGSADSGGGFDAPEDSGQRTGRKLIYTVDMWVETYSFDELLRTVNQKIEALGGYRESSDIQGISLGSRGGRRLKEAHITARIPSDRRDSFVEAVESGGNVISKSENARDVTLQYTDAQSRKKSLEVEQERIWALLEKADSLDAVITLEQRLSDIRYELENLESSLRLYDNQVDYSTVNLSICEVEQYTPSAPVTRSAAEQMKDGFLHNVGSLGLMARNIFISIIISSPFWVPAAVIAAIVAAVLKKKRKKREDTKSKGENQVEKEENQVK